MNFKRTLAGALALSLLLLGGCGNADDTSGADNTAAPTGTAVETKTVQRGEIFNESKLSGRVIASREVSVMSPLPAKVLSVKVKVGDTVAKDQVLFTLDQKDILKNYQPLLDNYNRTKTLTEETIRQAQKNVDDTQALLEIGAASQSQLDQAKLALLQQQTSAASQLSQLDESMKDINDTLKDTSVKAPIAGVVTTVNVVENNNASQSAPAVAIAENQKPQVSVSVAETLIPSLKVGDPVDITIPAVSATPFTAKIQSISPTTSSQTQLYEVKMDVPADAGYKVGMFANVTFRMNRHTDVVVIPSEAIQTDGQASWIFIVNDQGAASKVTVTTGLTSGESTEIIEGLAGGEQLVVKGQSYLSEGAEIRVVSKDGQEVKETAPAAPDAAGQGAAAGTEAKS
ncbi:MAG: efflux RND transporter periplasmic adaptor subunit [Intestinibacillus sp.]